MQTLLLSMVLLAPVLTFQWEFVVEGNKKACFEDHITNETTIIYGYTPFQVSSIEDLLQAMTPLANLTGIAFENLPKDDAEIKGKSRLLRMLQEETVKDDIQSNFLGKKNRDGTMGPTIRKGLREIESQQEHPPNTRRLLTEKTTKEEDNQIPLEESERKVYKGKKNDKENNQKTKTSTEPIELESGEKAPTNKGSNKIKTEFKGIGSLEILNSNGMPLSPAKVNPYSLYKLSTKKPFEIITICYESFIADDTLVRLTYKTRHRSFEEIPSKEDSDAMMQKLTNVETTFELFLKNYEELQRFEERFVSTSSDTLSRFMTFGQILLLAYLVVVWLLKLLIEKTFRYKKII